MVGRLLFLILSLLMIQSPVVSETIDQHAKTRDPLVVAILASGVDPGHPLLKDRLLQERDEIENHLIDHSKSVQDMNGHGTHTAGIVAQLTKENTKILPIKVVGDDGQGNVDALVKGIQYAASQQVDIILVSLGTPYYRKDIAEAVSEAWEAGALMFSATGNNGSEKVMYPAGNLYVIGVGLRQRMSANLL